MPKKCIQKEINGTEACEVFKRLELLMANDQLYLNPEIDIATISTLLNVNYSYLSKVIRLKGFDNFNQYLNTYRICSVKKLIISNDFQKMTLMFVYTEAGFKNQSTFNRVFKQIEGMTPSEYIRNLKESID